MSFKTVNVLKTKWAKDNSNSTRYERNRTRVNIENMLKEYLREPGDTLTFEALPSVLNSTLAVLAEGSLGDIYDIEQIDKTLFVATLREVGVF